MKITFEKDLLVEAMTPAMSAVSDRNTITAIEGILFTTDSADRVILSSYDLEKGYRTAVKAQVERPGSFIINAAKLFRMVRMMPESHVTIEVNEKFQARISSGNSVFALSALPGGDFPSLPDLNGERGVSIEQYMLKKMIGQIQHAIAVADPRPVFCGAYFRLTPKKVRIVSCDRNRLALREKDCALSMQDGNDNGVSFIVPGKTLMELSRMLSNDEDEKMVIAFGRKHVIFHMGESLFFSRLIDGEYIDYNSVIPKNNDIKVELDRRDLVESLERVSLVTDDKSVGQIRGYVKCVFEDNLLKVSSSSSVSSVSDEVATKKTGGDITIAFNCKYLLDALRAISDDRVRLSLATPLMSVLIEPVEQQEDKEDKEQDEGKFLYMVCPVKMKE